MPGSNPFYISIAEGLYSGYKSYKKSESFDKKVINSITCSSLSYFNIGTYIGKIDPNLDILVQTVVNLTFGTGTSLRNFISS